RADAARIRHRSACAHSRHLVGRADNDRTCRAPQQSRDVWAAAKPAPRVHPHERRSIERPRRGMRLRERLIAREHKADIVVVQGEDMTLASPVASSYSKNASARDVQRVIYRNPIDLARDRIAAGRDPVQSAPTPFTFARLGIAVDCRTGASLDAVLLLTVAREGELLGLAR